MLRGSSACSFQNYKVKGMGIFKVFTGILIALVCFVSPEPGFAAKGKAASPDALYEKARNSYYQVLDSPRQNWTARTG